MVVVQDNRALIEANDKQITVWLPKREDQELSNSYSYNKDNNMDYMQMIMDLRALGFYDQEIQGILAKLEEVK